MADSKPNPGTTPSSTAPNEKYANLNYDNPRATRYLPTTAAYDLWAAHYDHDGNFLQAMDDLEMRELFPRLVGLLKDGGQKSGRLKLLDLGCGTGRNTVLLLGLGDNLGGEVRTEVVAVDASEGMLGVAKERIRNLLGPPSVATAGGDNKNGQGVRFEVLDLLVDHPLPDYVRDVDVLVSTLVLEHIPCDIFFEKAAEMLKPGGLLLLTNMHSHMGGISQAGFVNPETGEKIRPTSYAHTVKEVEDQAKKHGLVPVGGIKETAVDETLVDRLGPRSRKWVGVTCWFGGIFRK